MRSLPHILAGVFLGGFIIATGAYVSVRWNSAVVIGNVRAVATLTTRDHQTWLAVNYHVIRSVPCPSWSQHTIFKDNNIDGQVQRNFVPLAITANGLGASPSTRDFAISFRLPPNLMPGRWYYVVVTSASCEWLPGLQRESMSQTEPVEIDIKAPTR